jgi:hypothetical protein
MECEETFEGFLVEHDEAFEGFLQRNFPLKNVIKLSLR